MCLFEALSKTAVMSLPAGGSFKRDKLNFGNSVGWVKAAGRSYFHRALLETGIHYLGDPPILKSFLVQ